MDPDILHAREAFTFTHPARTYESNPWEILKSVADDERMPAGGDSWRLRTTYDPAGLFYGYLSTI